LPSLHDLINGYSPINVNRNQAIRAESVISSFISMCQYIDIETFIDKSSEIPVLDVRTPNEYLKGHIPGAINFPLFSNKEREIIGTIYNQKGRHASIIKGLEYIGPKLKSFVARAFDLKKNNQLLVHCWRGGLRSSSMAWLFDIAGIKTYVLKGGYKKFRQFVLRYFQTPFKLLVIGGMTGSGKTEVLHYLQSNNQQVLDLEDFAHHKGSAFGSLGQPEQTSNEQFENNIFNRLYSFNPDEIIWIEDESQNIGRNLIPKELFKQILNANLIFIDVNINERITRLVREYSMFDKAMLKACIEKISKRLGGLNTKNAYKALEDKDFHKVAEIMLSYYDKTYLYSLNKHDPSKIHYLQTSTEQLGVTINNILKLSKKLII